ncbi:Na+/H+ antiporter NhaA [Shimia thalassica]|jgi:NhaA family Na+:H+ antiporter|uniref:Na+/H+ antiporter NhaA n=1 Tax=Shimia thalassica TaxID=1715693 RepID=UPI0026E13BE0|nr:Na+/H+ antiporter NhaA [Shimia thalassica]MDO6481492.1 Na+/H+ antiporter NhaA [Shimia thalassica]
MLSAAIDRFFKHEAAGGIMLMLAAALAMIVANSPMSSTYNFILDTMGAITMNGKGIEKPMVLWINDGLMAVFFFLIGLELKREFLEGKLKNPRDVILPGAAAIGGMAVPAMIFAYLNWDSPETLSGWAIPAATDIAFALGILALVGTRAPASLKVFLLTLAILDDIGAIIIIALFYTADLKVNFLVMAIVPLIILFLMNRARIHRTAPFVLVGIVLWVLVLKSGVHATLAGVVLAFFIPLYDRWGKSPLHRIEHGLEPYVYFFIVPVFAFANAGVVLGDISLEALSQPLPLGIMLGLILGKQIGVFGLTWVMVKVGAARLPHGANWMHIYGVACLAGIGFTMSLFIGGLSFASPELMNQVRLGVLGGSAVSGILGYVLLRMAGNAQEEEDEQAEAAA